MPAFREIRADFDRESLVVYQAYGPQIAQPTLRAGRFTSPFSWGRMTWIKPSFLWLMARSNWGQKSGQEHILAVRIRREGWDRALSLGALTSYEPKTHRDKSAWSDRFDKAQVHVQWDPERSIHGKKLQHRSIQVGLGRGIIREFTEDWVLDIADMTQRAKKIRVLYLAGKQQQAKELLPPERVYQVAKDIRRNLGLDG